MGRIDLGRVVGNKWYTGTDYNNVTNPLDGDMFLDIRTSYVYQYQGSIWIKVTQNIVQPSEYYSKEEVDEIVSKLVSRIKALEEAGGGTVNTSNLLFIDEDGNESSLIFVDEDRNENQISFEEEE